MSRPKKNKGVFGGRPTGGAGSKDGKKPSNDGGKTKERKKGFQVGPAHAAKNAYLGKAKKIKADLIMKSKLKREYAKVLKEEGVESSRLKSRGKERPHSTSPQTNEMDPNDSIEEETRGSGERKDGRQGKTGGKLDRRDSKRKEREHTQQGGKPGNRSLKRTNSKSSSFGFKGDKEPKRVRALFPSDIGAPMPQSSFLQLKKEAFKKYHPPPAAKSGGRSVSTGSAKSGSSGFGFGGFGGGRGQPNMGARMNVLLEKIKRDKA